MSAPTPGARQPAAWKPAATEEAGAAGSVHSRVPNRGTGRLEIAAGPDDAAPVCTATRHDTANAYHRYQCRCPKARAASNRLNKRHALRVLREGPLWVASLGATRRLRALSALGWPGDILAGQPEVRSTWNRTTVARLLQAGALIHRDTAVKVSAIYDRLEGTPGPSTRTRRRATAKGWLPPAAWDDIDDPNEHPCLTGPDTVDAVLVDRATAGQTPVSQLNDAERDQAIRILHGWRLNDTEIAGRLRCSERTILRARGRLGLPTVIPQHRREAG